MGKNSFPGLLKLCNEINSVGLTRRRVPDQNFGTFHHARPFGIFRWSWKLSIKIRDAFSHITTELIRAVRVCSPKDEGTLLSGAISLVKPRPGGALSQFKGRNRHFHCTWRHTHRAADRTTQSISSKCNRTAFPRQKETGERKRWVEHFISPYKPTQWKVVIPRCVTKGRFSDVPFIYTKFQCRIRVPIECHGIHQFFLQWRILIARCITIEWTKGARYELSLTTAAFLVTGIIH
jgi:hypothetical protein